MTLTIWKWNLQPVTTINMPVGAQILTAQEQGGGVALWALVDPGAQKHNRTFSVYATGQTHHDNPGLYIGTVQVQGGAIVLHVFETTGMAFTAEGGRDVETGD